MYADDLQGRRRRGLRLIVGYGLILLLLLVRVVHLQVARHDVLAKLSDKNRLKLIPEAPTRGRIYDRKNRILVDNRPSWTVTVTPVSPSGDDSVFAAMADILDVSEEQIASRVKERKGHRYTPVPVKRDVSFAEVARIAERGNDLPGVAIQKEPRRLYPYGDLASHVLGYLREIDEDELGRRQRQGEDYLDGDLVGKDGLEKTYESMLRGSKGIAYVEVDARGRTVRAAADRPERPPEHGRGLITTLDAELQEAAERAFADTARGAVVAIDPRDGGVLVLASLPEYGPLAFSGVLDQETADLLFSSEEKPMLDRAVAGLYPPASTFKMLTALAGLQQGVITPTTLLDPCAPGGWRFGIRAFQCWRSDHGRLTVTEAIEQSCDVFFYQVGVKVGLRPLHDLATAFGLGHTTGLDLPGEKAGSFPDADYYNRRLGSGKWNESSQVINLAIGQGEIIASPLQVAVVTAAFANGGRRVTPFLARYRVNDPGEPLEPLPHPAPQQIPGVDRAALDLVRHGLFLVMNGEKGTTRHLASRLPGIQVAGKSGTGENPHGENHAWFTCYAPAESPEIVVTVVVENGGGGSAVAAPIAMQVLRAYFKDRIGTRPAIVGQGGGR